MSETSDVTAWNSARVGDPTVSLPETEGDLCTRGLGPLVCCRPAKHAGQHVAVARDAGVVATWANPARLEVYT